MANKPVKSWRNTGRTHFKKGMTPWNKGLKRPEFSGENHPRYKGFVSRSCLVCQKEILVPMWRAKDETRGKFCSFTCRNKFKTGEKANRWKGDDVGYTGLHDWVKKHLGKAVWCEHCMSTINIQWANASHQYKRDLYDWMQLCQKCHKRYDKGRHDVKTLFFPNHGARRIMI